MVGMAEDAVVVPYGGSFAEGAELDYFLCGEVEAAPALGRVYVASAEDHAIDLVGCVAYGFLGEALN